MKITDIETIALRDDEGRDFTVVRVHTDEGRGYILRRRPTPPPQILRRSRSSV